jgi:hypothetical protein
VLSTDTYWDPIKAAGTPLSSELGAAVIVETDVEELACAAAEDTRSKRTQIEACMMSALVFELDDRGERHTEHLRLQLKQL